MCGEGSMIQARSDKKRSCGWRKPGGLYLVGGGLSKPCGRLPIPLRTCPTCGCGVKPSRGWQWVDADALAEPYPCKLQRQDKCADCALSRQLGRAGLLWIGSTYYKSPGAFERESDEQGVSRRIGRVPRGFVPGETWVMLGHRKAVSEKCPECKGNGGQFGNPKCDACNSTGMVDLPGIFRLFKPTAIEYVVTGKETEDELEAIVKRGIIPVTIERDEEDILLQHAEKNKDPTRDIW
jgi:hypothetical protein